MPILICKTYLQTENVSNFDLESLGQKQDIELKLDPSVGAVVVGFDGGLNYWKLMYAATYTVNEEKGLCFIFTF